MEQNGKYITENYFSAHKILLMNIIRKYIHLCSLSIFTHSPSILNIFHVFLLFLSLDYILVIYLALIFQCTNSPFICLKCLVKLPEIIFSFHLYFSFIDRRVLELLQLRSHHLSHGLTIWIFM